MPAAIVVMARSPSADPHTIKTRLASVIPDVSVRRQLYLAFLTDTLSVCRTLAGVSVRVAFAPAGSQADFVSLGLAPAELLAQPDGDLGARERGVFDALFAEGFDRVVMIGSDLPTLPAAHVRDAIAQVEVEAGGVVIGPSEDGGYYLLGLAGPRAPAALFAGIRWSTSWALEDTLGGARDAGLRVRLAPAWYDVDRAVDLERLRAELRDPAVAARAPATAAALGTLRFASRA